MPLSWTPAPAHQRMGLGETRGHCRADSACGKEARKIGAAAQ
jgi:hypothetical protein